MPVALKLRRLKKIVTVDVAKNLTQRFGNEMGPYIAYEQKCEQFEDFKIGNPLENMHNEFKCIEQFSHRLFLVDKDILQRTVLARTVPPLISFQCFLLTPNSRQIFKWGRGRRLPRGRV